MNIGNKIKNSKMLLHRNRDTYFYVYLISMLIMLLLRNALGVNIPVICLLLLTIIPAFFGTIDHVIAAAVCFIPMSTGFQFKYALFILIVGIIIRRKGQMRLSRVAYPVFLMMVWEIMHAFSGNFSFFEFLRSFAELIFLIVVLSIDQKKLNYKLIIRALAISTIGICFIMLFLQFQRVGFDLNNIFSRGFKNYRFGQANTSVENYGLNFNPNRLGTICNLTTVSILILFGRKEHTAFDMLLLVLSIIFGFMTFSRAYVISLIFIIFCFVITTKGPLPQKVLSIIGTLVFIAILLWSIKRYIPSVFYNMISRFQENDLFGGRDKLFLFYNEHIFSSVGYFLFGIGLQDFQGKISSIHNIDINVAHNGIQEIWVVWGVVGVVLFILMLINIIKDAKKYESNPEIRQFLPLGFLLFNSMAGQLIRSEITLLSLVMIYICLSIKREATMQNGTVNIT
jgi:hypothetical protein